MGSATANRLARRREKVRVSQTDNQTQQINQYCLLTCDVQKVNIENQYELCRRF